MNRIREYRRFRHRWAKSDQMSRRHAFHLAFIPIRIDVALHVLRGRPAIYRVNYEETLQIDKGNSNLLVAGCTIGFGPNGMPR